MEDVESFGLEFSSALPIPDRMRDTMVNYCFFVGAEGPTFILTTTLGHVIKIREKAEIWPWPHAQHTLQMESFVSRTGRKLFAVQHSTDKLSVFDLDFNPIKEFDKSVLKIETGDFWRIGSVQVKIFCENREGAEELRVIDDFDEVPFDRKENDGTKSLTGLAKAADDVLKALNERLKLASKYEEKVKDEFNRLKHMNGSKMIFSPQMHSNEFKTEAVTVIRGQIVLNFNLNASIDDGDILIVPFNSRNDAVNSLIVKNQSEERGRKITLLFPAKSFARDYGFKAVYKVKGRKKSENIPRLSPLKANENAVRWPEMKSYLIATAKFVRRIKIGAGYSRLNRVEIGRNLAMETQPDEDGEDWVFARDEFRRDGLGFAALRFDVQMYEDEINFALFCREKSQAKLLIEALYDFLPPDSIVEEERGGKSWKRRRNSTNFVDAKSSLESFVSLAGRTLLKKTECGQENREQEDDDNDGDINLRRIAVKEDTAWLDADSYADFLEETLNSDLLSFASCAKLKV